MRGFEARFALSSIALVASNGSEIGSVTWEREP